MKVDGQLPLFGGTLELVVLAGQQRVVKKLRRTNSIQTALKYDAPYNVGINNSAASNIMNLKGIDYSSSSGVNNWETGSTVPTQSDGGTYAQTYVEHTNSYTAGGAGFTVKRMRMRRMTQDASHNDIAATLMLSLVTGLSVSLSSGWKILTTWRIGVQ